MPWPRLAKLTRATLPGKITLICGNPGEGKSLIVLEAFAHWYNQGVKGALYELEDDRAHHLHRALVQRTQNPKLAEEEWVKANADEVRKIQSDNAPFLAGFGKQIKTAPDESVTHEDVLAWIKERCDAGCRVLGIDPITAVEQGDKQWLADQNFITKAKKIIRASGTSLVLVIHPKKNRPRGGSALEDMAGGIAFARFCDTALWLEAVERKDRDVTAPGVGASVKSPVNRIIRVRKCRNGKAGGWSFGFDFDEGMRFAEQGVLVD
jgi:RecA-family ATPase